MAVKPGTMPTGTGEGYEILMGRWSRILSAPFLDFVGLTDSGRILDAGCGTGALSAEIVKRTSEATVTGVDLAEAYIAYASDTVSDARAGFEVGDLTALSFADGSFDAIVSNLVLHFVPKTDAAISEMIRGAKPGAIVAANVWDSRSGLVPTRIFLDTASVIDPKAAELRKQMAVRPLSRPGELTAAWEACGLKDVRACLRSVMAIV
jgi:ubiquinone/menaquinone biosynthesis C-methylase UbiE